MANSDYRVKLRAKPGAKDLVYPKTSDLMRPIANTNGLIFPYSPEIQVNLGTPAYSSYDIPHTNYEYFAWNKSTSPSLTVNGQFTANTYEEARYLLAVLNFFRIVCRGEFGLDNSVRADTRGAPPPTLLFSAYGPYMFKNLPVLVRTVTLGLLNDVDYVPAGPPESPGGTTSVKTVAEGLAQTYVPASCIMFIDLVVAPDPGDVRDHFSLESFRTGKYIEGQNANGSKSFF
jgi:hypothetical protein|tara:strand:+ start:4044 stop:4736 length:693 start_codon:yes stop_codon:yes gene_type:complete